MSLSWKVFTGSEEDRKEDLIREIFNQACIKGIGPIVVYSTYPKTYEDIQKRVEELFYDVFMEQDARTLFSQIEFLSAGELIAGKMIGILIAPNWDYLPTSQRALLIPMLKKNGKVIITLSEKTILNISDPYFKYSWWGEGSSSADDDG